MKFVDREIISDFFKIVLSNYKYKADIFLIGESSLVCDGLQSLADKLEFTAQVDFKHAAHFEDIIQAFKDSRGVEILNESPEKIIPLPGDHSKRAIEINIPVDNKKSENKIHFFHFDPYSVSFRFIARGDETDYKLVINYLANGWIKIEELEKMMQELLPKFSFQTIQQDPAEFRRKYKGLLQMWRTIRNTTGNTALML